MSPPQRACGLALRPLRSLLLHCRGDMTQLALERLLFACMALFMSSASFSDSLRIVQRCELCRLVDKKCEMVCSVMVNYVKNKLRIPAEVPWTNAPKVFESAVVALNLETRWSGSNLPKL